MIFGFPLLFLACLTGVSAQVEDLVDLFYSQIWPEANLSAKCTEQIQETVNAIQSGEEWALMMLDATAKPQAGLLLGNVMHVGNFDECLRIDAETKAGRVRGKYCTAVFAKRGAPREEPDVERIRFSFGICMPSSCDGEEIQNLIEVQERHVQSELQLHFFEKYCDSVEKVEALSTGAVAAIAILVAVVLSTVYDVYVYQKAEGHKSDLLVAFSLYTNGKKMFSTKTGEDNLDCLNGIRVISMMWIVLGHGYMTYALLPLNNAVTFYEWIKQPENMIIPAGNMGVDTFFAVSGLLVVYVYLRAQEKHAKFNLFVFYLHRYLRLTPALAAVVLFYATLIMHLGSGPFWPIVYLYAQDSCIKRWWSTLLYVQNYANPSQECVGQSWYLAVDTQLYFLSPLILIPLVKWPRKAIIAIIVVGLASAAGAFATTWHYNFGSSFFDQESEMNDKYFVATHFRMTPWLVGAVFGWIIFRSKKRTFKLTRVQVLLMWTFSLTVMCAAVFGQVDFNKYERNRLSTSVFNSVARPSWAFALCVIIFLCVHGYGGLINDFLSANAFTILVRLNYSIYLLHQLIIIFFSAPAKGILHLDNRTAFHRFWGDFCFTLAVSVVFSLAFESPIIAIEKLVFRKGAERKPDPSTQQNFQNNVVVAVENSTEKFTKINVN